MSVFIPKLVDCFVLLFISVYEMGFPNLEPLGTHFDEILIDYVHTTAVSVSHYKRLARVMHSTYGFS